MTEETKAQHKKIKRISALSSCMSSFNLYPTIVATKTSNMDIISPLNNPQKAALAKEKEKGERCFRCYEFRLKKAFEYAKKNAFDYFCTTLSISPFKDAEKINVIGELLEKSHREKNPNGFCPKWLISDFKKKGGFQRSLEISREYDLYRQQYCGCVFSM
mgnify:CR=1 FL=1